MKPQLKFLVSLWVTGILGFSALSAAQDKVEAPSQDDTDSAVGCMRTINTAEVTYAATYNKGYSPTLAALGEPLNGSNLSPSAAGLIDHSLAGGKRNRYVYKYQAGMRDAKGTIKTYTATARPMKWQKGARSFFTDQSGVIRWTEEDRAPTAKDPAIQ